MIEELTMAMCCQGGKCQGGLGNCCAFNWDSEVRAVLRRLAELKPEFRDVLDEVLAQD